MGRVSFLGNQPSNMTNNNDNGMEKGNKKIDRILFISTH